jgi:hypothetical protein
VVNLGTITASNAGFAALVAPGVRNSGTITATLGKVALASGNGFTLDPYGDQLITLSVSDSIAAQVTDVATGQTLQSLVQERRHAVGQRRAGGTDRGGGAAGGRFGHQQHRRDRGALDRHPAGKIVLGAATAATKPAGAPKQTVKLSGTLTCRAPTARAAPSR